MGNLLIVLLAIPLALAGLSLLTSWRIIRALTAIGSMSVLILALVVAFAGIVDRQTLSTLGGAIYLDSMGTVFLLTVALVYGLTGVYSIGYLEEKGHVPVVGDFNRNYYIFFNLFGWTMLLVPLLNNLAVLWIAIELTTILSAVLVALEGTETAVEASWKYILIASSGLALALVSVIMLYYAGTGPLGMSYQPDWTALVAAAPQLQGDVVKLAFLLAVLGFGTKAGLAPMHTWLPDAHSEAPSSISAMLSGALLADALYAIFRMYAIAVRSAGAQFSHEVLLGFGLISLLISAFFVLRQQNYKRLLAYSSVEHMGLMAVAVSFGAPLALYGVFLHVINHAATKSMIFFGAGSILRKYESKEMQEVSGVIKLMPATGPLILVAVLAVTGLPPFGIFRSELLMLSGGFSHNSTVAAAVFLALINLAFLGIFFFFNRMIFSAPTDRFPRGEVSRWMVTAMALDVIVVLGLGLYVPDPLVTIFNRAAALMGG